MLQQFIQRRLRPTIDRDHVGDATTPRSSPRPADWLLGGSVATLAVVFVAGLLGLRASTADLADQSRNNTRDLAALKADTLERIEGISGTLAKTNQTLTDLLALRSGGATAKGRSAAGGDVKPSDGGEGGDRDAGVVPVKTAAPRIAAAVPKPASRPAAKAVGKPGPVKLSTITVKRRPERERSVRRSEPPPRPVAAPRPEPRTATQVQRARREAILRELRQRRLARRGYGPL